MKELSVEQKAKAYDEAKLRISAAYNSNRCTIGFMNEIFPELKESEDERIRKAIGYAIGQSTHSDGTLINGVSSEEALVWLEKQGEKKPYGQREECLDCQVNYAGECKGFCELKRNEKKPAWSEEDERMFRSLHNLIYVVRDCDCDSSEKKELSDWLKSLKDRIGE